MKIVIHSLNDVHVVTKFIYWKKIVIDTLNKGNNKITELRTILQRESQISFNYINRQNQSTTGKLGKP